MSTELATIPLAQASSDDHLVELWLHGRSPHTQRAYRADAERFRSGAGKPLALVTLSDLQAFADSLAGREPAGRYRCLSSVKSLLAFGHRIGYLAFDVGRALRLPPVRNGLPERILPEADLHRLLSLEPDERNRVLLLLLVEAITKTARGREARRYGVSLAQKRPAAHRLRHLAHRQKSRPARRS